MRWLAETLDYYARNIKLRPKLFLAFFIVSLIPLITATAIMYQSASKALEKELGASVVEIVLQVDRQLGSFVNETEKVDVLLRFDQDVDAFLRIEEVTNDTRNISVLRDLRKKLRDIARMRAGLSSIHLINDHGVVLFDSLEMADLAYNFLNDPWFRKVSSLGGFKLYPAHPQSYIQGDPVISFVSRLVDYNDLRERGTLLIDFNPEFILDMNENINLGASGYVFMLSEDGTPVIPNQALPAELIQGAHFQSELSRHSGHFITQVEGRSMLVGFTTSLKTKWKIVGVVPFSEVSQGLDAIRKAVMIMVIGAALLIYLISINVSRAIESPLKRLQQYMKVVETGDFTPRVSMVRSDEFGLLDKKFNHMIARLHELQKEVYEVQIREYRLQLLHKDSELKALHAQIKPHFLYNTLNTMVCIGQVNQVEEVSVMSSALADMFKYSIEGGVTTNLGEELKHVENYLQIIQIRYPGFLFVHKNIPEQFLESDVLKLILQPIVENAILHGLLPKKCNGNIWISVHEKNEYMVIRLTDDGIGMDRDKVQMIQQYLDGDETAIGSDSSLGLRNVMQRLRMYYGEAGLLRLASDRNRGTIVELQLPLDIRVEVDDGVPTPDR